MVDLFSQLKDSISNIDPVYFAERYLTLDGKPFRLTGNGYKPFSDIYRYIGVTSLSRDPTKAKPVVLVKGRQVGATTMAAALSLYFGTSGQFGVHGKPPMRMLHAFPNLIHVERYSKQKLSTMISTAVVEDKKNKGGKSFVESKIDKNGSGIRFKRFENGNTLMVESTGVNADRLRNATVDCIWYDEFQEIFKEAVVNANKLLTKAQYGPHGFGIQVYMGTPKLKGSTYHEIWEKSSQQYYYLGCEKCNNYFPLYTPGNNDWCDKIWLYGFTVKCTHCGHEQDKRDAAERGSWVATTPNEECRYIGFHINQLYMPDFDKNRVLADSPANNLQMTDRGWQNEVLGEFYAGEAGLITTEEIKIHCADFERKFSSGILPGDGIKIYAGFDWGKRNADDSGLPQGGQSYSTCVVIADEGNLLSIIFATALQKNDFEYKKNLVEQILRQYSVTKAVGDIGYANDLSEILHNTYGDRFIVSNSLAKVNSKIMYNDGVTPKTIFFEKDYCISELIDLLKRGRVRFPYGDFEKISWLIEHCASMEIKTTFNVYNEPVKRFVKGKTPNDGLMALLNAYLAYKFELTGGFTDGNSTNMIRQPTNQIPAVLARMTRI